MEGQQASGQHRHLGQSNFPHPGSNHSSGDPSLTLKISAQGAADAVLGLLPRRVNVSQLLPADLKWVWNSVGKFGVVCGAKSGTEVPAGRHNIRP